MVPHGYRTSGVGLAVLGTPGIGCRDRCAENEFAIARLWFLEVTRKSLQIADGRRLPRALPWMLGPRRSVMAGGLRLTSRFRRFDARFVKGLQNRRRSGTARIEKAMIDRPQIMYAHIGRRRWWSGGEDTRRAQEDRR